MQTIVGVSDALKIDDIQKHLNTLNRYLATVQNRIIKKQQALEEVIAHMSPKERELLQKGLQLHHLNPQGNNV